MIVIEPIRMSYYKDPRDKELLDKIIPFIKEVFGYTDKEIEGFKEKIFFPPLAVDVTIEQAKLAIQPFLDHGTEFLISEFDDNPPYEIINNILWTKLGLTRQAPKNHYYDEPVIRRDQLVDPYNPPKWRSEWTTGYTFKPTPPQPTRPTITCPYCKSTNCKKISALLKAGSVFMWGIFALGKTTKQWHCNNCGSEF